nr:NADP-dependent malic enzyme gene [Tanacetum cinerariifolium]
MSTPTFAKTHNLIAYLAKPTKSEGFEQIIDFLNGSSVSYALTTSPTIQGTSCLANAEIFDGLAKMGYEKLSEKLTFYKAFFSPQWKFLIHTVLKCLIKNIEAGVPFFMFPRFAQLLIDHQLGDMSHHKDIYDNHSLIKKVFANMKRVGTGFSGIVTPLFDTMLVSAAEKVGLYQDDVHSTTIPTEPSTSKPHKKHKSKKQQPQALEVPSPEPLPEHKLPSPSNDPLRGDRIEKLKGRVDRLEEENRNLKDLYNVYSKVDTAAPVVEKEKSFKHGRIIAEIDKDVEINLEEAQAKLYKIDLEHPGKVLSMQDVNDEEPAKVKEVLEVVKTAKLMTEVVTTAGATTTTTEATKVSVPRRRRGVVIQDPEETTSTVVVHSEVQSKDKGKVMKYQALKRKPLTKAQARKNMIIYLKNMAGFKMNYFKEMTYNEIRPLFEKHYNYDQAFLEEVNEEITIPEKEYEVEGHKREGESLEKEVTKKKKMDEEVEDLKSHLQIFSNDDDDVYTEATPLASKIPIVDYKIHFERNKPYFKIIRADGNHMLFLSFSTMLKNFNREDLESLWKLVKERDQKGRYGLAKVKSWKLFESIGVHCITFSTTQMFLLVEKRYHLTHFTLEQMLNNVRLEVKEVSEMSLELLRLVKRQLIEGGGFLGIMDFNILLLLFILSVAAWKYCWCLRPNGRGLILYQAYGNLYAMTALSWNLEEIHVTLAHLWKKETRLQVYTKVDKEFAHRLTGDAVRSSRDGIRNFETTSGLNRHSETLEDLANRRRQNYKATSLRLPSKSGFNGMHVTARKKRLEVTHEHFDNGPIYPPFTNIRKPYAHIAAKVAAKVQVKHKVSVMEGKSKS